MREPRPRPSAGRCRRASLAALGIASLLLAAACGRPSVPPPAEEGQPPAPEAAAPLEAGASPAAAVAATREERAPQAVSALPVDEARAAAAPATASPPPSGSPSAPGADAAAGAGEARSVRVGLLVPLSGRYAPEGEALLRAAQLALFDAADEAFALLPRDTGGSAAGAERAALSLLGEGVDLILGPLFADGVAAVASHARARGVAVVAFSTDREVAGEGVYLLGHAPGAQVRRVVAHAAAHGHRRLALLAPETRYGAAVADETAAAAAAAGLSLTRVRHYAPDGSDAAQVVRALADYDRRSRALEEERAALARRGDAAARRGLARLSRRDTLGAVAFDALLLADGGARLRQIAALLPYYDIDPAEVRLLGTGLWEDPATLGEPTLAGGWFAGPGPAARRDFEARYRRAFGESPGAIASLGYDATALAAVLAQAGAGLDSRAIGGRRGFVGVDGLFRFDADGMAERSLAVFEVAGGGETVVVGPAPGRFDRGAEASADGEPERSGINEGAPREGG